MKLKHLIKLLTAKLEEYGNLEVVCEENGKGREAEPVKTTMDNKRFLHHDRPNDKVVVAL